jgi:hypothetical protein
MKNELQNLIHGKGGDGKTNLIQKIAAYLRGSKKTSIVDEGEEYSRKQEEESLTDFINNNDLWYTGIISEYTKIGEGAEQSVYYDPVKGAVIKTNDAIFFAFWLDYLNNLIVHNYFFPDTAYSLLGFQKKRDILFAVVEQSHIVRTSDLNISDVKEFLEANGFVNTRRNDYYNDQLGIILEDLHEENVINSSDVLFFIDTVFYLTDKFYLP